MQEHGEGMRKTVNMSSSSLATQSHPKRWLGHIRALTGGFSVVIAHVAVLAQC